MSEAYLVSRTAWARKLWFPRGRPSLNRPRQLAAIAGCLVRGHAWKPWTIDDMDGTGEFVDGDPECFMPYGQRESRLGEWGMRHCARCRGMQTRWPAGEAPPLVAGRLVVLP